MSVNMFENSSIVVAIVSLAHWTMDESSIMQSMV